MNANFYSAALSQYSGDRYTPVELQLKKQFLGDSNKSMLVRTLQASDASFQISGSFVELMTGTFTRNVDREKTLDGMNQAFLCAYDAKVATDEASRRFSTNKFHTRANLPTTFIPRAGRKDGDDEARFHTIENSRMPR